MLRDPRPIGGGQESDSEWLANFRKEMEAAKQQVAAQGQATEDPYEGVRQSFAAQSQLPSGLGAFSYAGPTRTQEGWQRVGSVYVNPALGAQGILFPTAANGVNPAEVEGSEEWLQTIQDKWDDEKFNTWRKRLIDLGYDSAVTGGIAEKGGKALDVIDGLRAYWQSYYLNGGKAIPLRPVNQQTREAVRKQVDFQSLKEEVKAWGTVPFGEGLDEKTADYFAEKLVRKMTQLANKHPEWTMEQVQAGAEMRTQKEFVEAPGVKQSLRDAEEDEMDETLRESIVSIAQLGSIR